MYQRHSREQGAPCHPVRADVSLNDKYRNWLRQQDDQIKKARENSILTRKNHRSAIRVPRL
jgi:hypothetical protein